MSKISVFGMGYVGIVLAACLADNGHDVLGVDINPAKLKMVNEGYSPIIEEGIGELVKKVVCADKLRGVESAHEAVHATEISFVCVGTPSRPNGSINLAYLQRVSEEIGIALASKDGYHLVVARSTMLPGSMEAVIIPLLEKSSRKKAGVDFGVCFNPEFLREGTSIKDFYDPPYTIIGATDEKAGRMLEDIYAMLKAPVYQVPMKVAEMVKYANNAFHAMKVIFANEFGNICKQQEVDSHIVMDLVCKDTKLNLSPYYMKSGFAFGGSCLPKDLRAILYHSHRFDLRLPMLESLLPSNEKQIDIAYEMIERIGSRKVGVLGFSFKEGTDDLRESPMVELIEKLIGRGFQVKVHDKQVSLANLQGANRAYIEATIPHISSLMVGDVDQILATCDVIVMGNKAPEYKDVFGKLRDDQTMIDLVRIVGGKPSTSQYQGIAW